MSDLAKLLLRLSFGLCLALAHGLGKLTSFSEYAASFPNPLGFGSAPSMALVIFAEFFCGILVALGLFTRLSTLPILIVMATAFFKIHAGQSWDNKEAAFLYGMAFVCISLLGSGRFSLDYLFFKKH